MISLQLGLWIATCSTFCLAYHTNCSMHTGVSDVLWEISAPHGHQARRVCSMSCLQSHAPLAIRPKTSDKTLEGSSPVEDSRAGLSSQKASRLEMKCSIHDYACGRL